MLTSVNELLLLHATTHARLYNILLLTMSNFTGLRGTRPLRFRRSWGASVFEGFVLKKPKIWISPKFRFLGFRVSHFFSENCKFKLFFFFKFLRLNQRFLIFTKGFCVVNAAIEFLTYCLHRRLATPKSALQNINF